MQLINAKEGFRIAPTHKERVHEAATLFSKGRSGRDAAMQAKLIEAFTTHDFPALLGDAFQTQALQAQEAATQEFEQLYRDETVDNFLDNKFVDMWSDDEFEEVNEGEEYKAGTLQTHDEIRYRTRKQGKKYGLTYELIRNRQFSALANFPKYLGDGDVRGQNTAVSNLLVDAEGNWNAAMFGDSIANTPLTGDNLQAAIQDIAMRENYRGDLLDTSNLALVYGPALRPTVEFLLNADELELTVEEGNKKVTRRLRNPFRNMVTPIESRTIGKRLTNKQGWALVQMGAAETPAIIRSRLSGHENLEIRVKSDQGRYIGGGDVPFEQGSFDDDTLWYRGRSFWNFDAAFTDGNYASNGG